jgi:hypothetical protein
VRGILCCAGLGLLLINSCRSALTLGVYPATCEAFASTPLARSFHHSNQTLSASLCEAPPIADATLRKLNDFLGDKFCRRIVTNLQMQSLTRCH